MPPCLGEVPMARMILAQSHPIKLRLQKYHSIDINEFIRLLKENAKAKLSSTDE
jgi:hypothetical protein